MNRAILIVVASGALTACAAPELSTNTADYGPYPADYKTQIDSYHAVHLKDPDSAQVKYLSTPQRAAMGFSWKASYGYVVCLTVNAKNSFGGYTGGQLTAIYFRNGQIVSYMAADHSSDGQDLNVRDSCKKVVGKFDLPEGVKG